MRGNSIWRDMWGNSILEFHVFDSMKLKHSNKQRSQTTGASGAHSHPPRTLPPCARIPHDRSRSAARCPSTARRLVVFGQNTTKLPWLERKWAPEQHTWAVPCSTSDISTRTRAPADTHLAGIIAFAFRTIFAGSPPLLELGIHGRGP